MKELFKAIEKLLYLNSCEQEGIGPGMPSQNEWKNAFNELEKHYCTIINQELK